MVPERARRGRPRKTVAPKPRKRATRPAAVASVDAIIHAAELVLERHGVAGLTTNRIADVAGVSIGTLYQYFPNREAIIAEIYGRYIASFARVIPEVLAKHGSAPLPELVEHFIAATIDVYVAQPPIHAQMLQLRTSSESDLRVAEHMAWLADQFAMILTARSAIAPERANAVAFTIANACDGVAVALSRGATEQRVRAVGAELVRMLAAYLSQL